MIQIMVQSFIGFILAILYKNLYEAFNRAVLCNIESNAKRNVAECVFLIIAVLAFCMSSLWISYSYLTGMGFMFGSFFTYTQAYSIQQLDAKDREKAKAKAK